MLVLFYESLVSFYLGANPKNPMKERFEGDYGQRRLASALCSQKISAGDSTIAAALATEVQLVELKAGDTLIYEGGSDNDIYFILSGSFSIVVKGRVIAKRVVNDSVGEMSAINPSIPRSAAVVADELSVVAKVSEDTLTKIANSHPDVWRNLAKELGARLFQRNTLIGTPNEKPRIFVISSSETLFIANEVQAILGKEYAVDVWNNGTFFVSGYALEALERQVDQSDYAIAIAHKDDIASVRGKDYYVPRDNVLFELGLFMGRLGRRRAILFQQAGEGLKLPSDLQGLTVVSYEPEPSSDLTSRLALCCHEVRKVINELGTRR